MDYYGLVWIIMDERIKFDCQEQLGDGEVYLVAATLRPETMYGQTNCFVLPEGAVQLKLKKIGPMAGQQIFEATSFSQVFQCAKFPFVSFGKTIHDLGDDLALWIYDQMTIDGHWHGFSY